MAVFPSGGENGTVICISKEPLEPFTGRNVFFTLENVGNYTLTCAIYGGTAAATAATVTFFWSLQHQAKAGTVIFCSCDRKNGFKFGFGARQGDQLAQILDSNQTRRFVLAARINAEQFGVLATRSSPLNLQLVGHGFAFIDNGLAFVDALENRQYSFGSLFTFCGPERMCMSF